jgi:hypothetical protein
MEAGMNRRGIWVLGLALGLGLAGSAFAQEDNKQGDLNVFLRGGVSDYTGELGDDVNAGPAWGLTVNVQPMRSLGFELGYEGSKNDVASDLVPDASFMRHGISGLLKVSPPLIEKVKPFVGVGLGASYISVDGGGGLYDSDLVEEVPVAAGLEFNSGAITAGVRGTYRLLVDEGLAADAAPGNPQGGLFDASFTLGGRF